MGGKVRGWQGHESSNVLMGQQIKSMSELLEMHDPELPKAFGNCGPPSVLPVFRPLYSRSEKRYLVSGPSGIGHCGPTAFLLQSAAEAGQRKPP